jgi:hypothetical protein
MTDNARERERKFKDLLARLVKSPLYKEKLSEYNLNGVGLEHIQTLPLTTKKDHRKAGVFGHLAVEMKEVAQYHIRFPYAMSLPAFNFGPEPGIQMLEYFNPNIIRQRLNQSIGGMNHE